MNDTPKFLGRADEPQQSGAIVAVHYGDYRRQELWVSSGANIGEWYPLGGEFWVVWDRQRMPAGVTRQHPTWSDVLARGPVTLLVPAGDEAYRQGWRAGRRDLWQAMEEVAEEDPREVVASGTAAPAPTVCLPCGGDGVIVVEGHGQHIVRTWCGACRCGVCGRSTDTPPECGECAVREDAMQTRRADV